MQNDPFSTEKINEGVNAGIGAVKDAAAQASDFVKRQTDRGSREVGGRLNAAADGLDGTGDELLDRGHDLTAGVARYVSHLLRRAGTYLENTEADEMMEDAREFARRQPWTLVSAGFIAGFALSRAIKHAMPGDERHGR